MVISPVEWLKYMPNMGPVIQSDSVPLSRQTRVSEKKFKGKKISDQQNMIAS
jgi:hypothetical protein